MKLLVVFVATSAASPLEELLDSEGMAVEGAEAGAYREGRRESTGIYTTHHKKISYMG